MGDARQKRKYLRFEVHCSVRVSFRSGKSVAEVETISRNVSIDGLLLKSPLLIPRRTPVDFVMTIQGGPLVRPIQVKGKGKVVRVKEGGSEAGFVIAVQCKNSLMTL